MDFVSFEDKGGRETTVKKLIGGEVRARRNVKISEGEDKRTNGVTSKELGIPLEKLNTCGGAIALGHPLAASGSRISAHLVHKIRQNNVQYGLGSACIGGGQGIAILFEKV